MYEITDPVHQTVAFDEKEKAVIDHPIFQRMRYIRQLGMSFLVYPGAVHDRFSHMLGAMHVVGRIWDNIVRVSGETLLETYTRQDLDYFREILRFGALLHDVGHAPFSHCSEKLLPELGTLETPKEWYKDWKPKRQAEHEDYSVMLIAALGREKKLPGGEAEAQDVASLIHHGIRPSEKWEKRYGEKDGLIHAFLSSLLSGEIDADRMDYLLRDAHYTGVPYGVYDVNHLIRNIGATLKDGHYRLTIDAQAVRAFEDFLLARYHMFLQVYHHKTTNAFDYFLRQAFTQKEVSVEVPGTVAGYLRLHDSTFIEALFQAAERPEHHWSRRFVERHPAKRLYVAEADDAEARETLRRLRTLLEKAEVPHFAINSHQYMSKLDATRVRRRGEIEMLVRGRSLDQIQYTPVQKYSALLRKYNEASDLISVYVLPEHYEAAKAAIKGLKP